MGTATHNAMEVKSREALLLTSPEEESVYSYEVGLTYKKNRRAEKVNKRDWYEQFRSR